MFPYPKFRDEFMEDPKSPYIITLAMGKKEVEPLILISEKNMLFVQFKSKGGAEDFNFDKTLINKN